MEDSAIVELYFRRSEAAISETAAKYGGYCHSIAHNILANKEDTQECVSDTWFAAWNAIPPRRPAILATFLGKITRRLAIDRYRRGTAAKRGGGEIPLALVELGECIGHDSNAETALERKELAAILNGFLGTLTETERSVFLCRYWYLDSIPVIAQNFGFSQSKVTSLLFRLRGRLRDVLTKEGYQ